MTMTLRDLFAAVVVHSQMSENIIENDRWAMQVLHDAQDGRTPAQLIQDARATCAECAYEWADAMLAARAARAEATR